MTKSSIVQFISDICLIDEDRAGLIEELRSLALKQSKKVIEEIKYGGILFSDHKPFCGVFSYKSHVTLELSGGSELEDKFKVLEGSGKTRRHIKLNSMADITKKHVKEYIKQAHMITTNDA